MGLTERAELVARLSLKDDFTAGVNRAISNANAKSTGLAANFRGVGLAAGFGAAAGSFAYGALAGAIGRVGDVLNDATQSFIEDEQSVARLGAALKANVQSWDGNTKAIEATIAARMRLGFTDEEQRNSLGLLLSATGDVNKALEIQRTAMDLAAFSGKDLGSAVEALTKVEAGSFRLLKGLGIELAEGATQADALAAVMRVAGGAADALADTTGGKLKDALIRSNEQMEKVGKAWAPYALGVEQAKAGVLDFIGRGLEGFTLLGQAAEDYNKKTGRALDGSKRRAGDYAGAVETELEKIPEAAAKSMKQTAEALSTGWTEAQRATIKEIKANKFGAEFFDLDLGGVKEAFFKGGEGVMAALAAGINARRQVPLDSFDTLVEMLKHELTAPQEFARLKGQLFSKELAKGLKSQDPAVRAQAGATLDVILTRLLQIGGTAELAGLQASQDLIAGLTSIDPEIRAAADKVNAAFTTRLAELKGQAYILGTEAAEEYRRGLNSGASTLGTAAADLIRKYGKPQTPVLPFTPAPSQWTAPLPQNVTNLTVRNYISGNALSADQERQETYQTRVSQ